MTEMPVTKRGPSPVRHERGQVLALLALMIVVLVGVIGLAVDLGRIYIEKAQLSRALDAAALAGTLELPDTAMAESEARDYLGYNMPRAEFLAPDIDVPNQRVTIRAKSPVDMVFLRLVGIDEYEVHAEAQAGASSLGDADLPLDVTVLLDDTGTMASGCTDEQRTTPGASQSSPTCPIGLTRNAAKDFLGVLAQGGTLPVATNVGFLSFRGCYADTNLNPLDEPAPPPWRPLRGCVKFSDTIALSNSVSAIEAKIDTMRAAGGFPGTNLCLGFAQAGDNIFGAGSRADARKVVIILTDGENRYSDFSHQDVPVANSLPTPNRQLANPAPNTYPSSTNDSNGSPSSDGSVNNCWPGGPTLDATAYGSDYDSRINDLDEKTLEQADSLKEDDVEIFVVGYGVNGAADPGTTCDSAMRARVGSFSGRNQTGTSDTQGDRELAKCIASSKEGTNDHYFETNAAGLSDVFTYIAQVITYRLVK
jgi:Flp pilus assembly protein TadG